MQRYRISMEWTKVLDAYQDGNADFHQIVAEMAEIPREQAKTINLGLFYGMGKNKLQAELGIKKKKLRCV